MKKLFSLLIATALFVTMSTSVFANDAPVIPEANEPIDILLINPDNTQSDFVNEAIATLALAVKNSGLFDPNSKTVIVVEGSHPATQDELNILAQEKAGNDADSRIADCPGPVGHEFYTEVVRTHTMNGSLCYSYTFTAYSCRHCIYSYVVGPHFQGSHTPGTNGCPIQSA